MKHISRRLTLALLATTLLAACQSNTDDQTQTMLNERTEESESQDNQQTPESMSDDQEQDKEESSDQTDQEGDEADKEAGPAEDDAAAQYDEASEEDQMVLNAYALFDKEDDVKFDDSSIPEWQSDESVKQLFYYVDGEDVYFVILRDNDDYHVTAHAQLTDDGLQPIQVTGYGVKGGSVQQYGDNNWLSDQDVISKEDIWDNGNERLQQFKDDGNEATSDENTYIEFVKTFSTSEDGGIESLDDELTDEELVFAAQIENQDIPTDNLRDVLCYGSVIEPIDGGYKVTGMQYPYEDDYYISGDEITSELNNDTDETYANGETTSTHSISDLQEKYAEYKPQLTFMVASGDRDAFSGSLSGRSTLIDQE